MNGHGTMELDWTLFKVLGQKMTELHLPVPLDIILFLLLMELLPNLF